MREGMRRESRSGERRQVERISGSGARKYVVHLVCRYLTSLLVLDF